jgi:dephospho-CoA kinase
MDRNKTYKSTAGAHDSMNKLIAIVGMCGSGKTTAADMLVEHDFQFIRFGQICLDEVQKRGLEVNEQNEKRVREQIRQEHGMGAFATLNIPKFDELLEKGNVVADGLYSWTEYKILKEKYGEQIITLIIYASPKTRYARLAGRERPADDKEARFRVISPEDAKARDYAEIENIEKAGPTAMADYLINNEGELETLKAEVEKFIAWL